jgi:hypothetical protein
MILDLLNNTYSLSLPLLRTPSTDEDVKLPPDLDLYAFLSVTAPEAEIRSTFRKLLLYHYDKTPPKTEGPTFHPA